MTLALWCVLAAALLPYVCTSLAKASRSYNNAAPRDWLARQTGWRARAHAAQLNSFEAFPPFAAAVIIAQLLAGPSATANALALAFIGLRSLYIACYVGNYATARSLLWFAACLCSVGLFIVAAKG